MNPGRYKDLHYKDRKITHGKNQSKMILIEHIKKHVAFQGMKNIHQRITYTSKIRNYYAKNFKKRKK